MLNIDDAARTELEAAFRRLTALLRERTDVQNIDIMNLAGFCRNCLSNWIEDAARDRGLPVGKAEARQHVYGMPYDEWKALHQRDASPAQARAFADGANAHGATPSAPRTVDPASRAADV